MQPFKLNSGTTMPPIGFGLWQVKDESDCLRAVRAALDVGYRHFDTAQIYGNEAFVGKALQSSSVSRNELFVTTKLWNEDQGWDSVIPSLEQSLQNLQTDYVDLFLVHFPVTDHRRPAWRKMEEIANSGRAKAIGVSNYTIKHLEELLREGSIKPTVNQVELHVYLQQPELVEFCKAHDILVEAYSPLAHGTRFDDQTLAEVAAKHSKTAAQIMIRWCIEIGTVPLPRSVKPDRIKENFEVFDFKLDQEDMIRLKQLEDNYRTCWDPTNVA